jgi:hypothetical protein
LVLLRASVRNTCVGSRHDLRRGGHIDIRAQADARNTCFV